MAKKQFLMGIAGIGLAFGLVLAGCDKDPQEVEGTVTADAAKAEAVSEVTVTPTTDGLYKIVTWGAVADVPAKGYTLYYKQDGKLTEYLLASGNAYNENTYATANGKATKNPPSGIDNFAYRVPVLDYASSDAALNYQIGVQTTDIYSRKSDIRWSASQSFPKASVYASSSYRGEITESGSYDNLFSFDGAVIAQSIDRVADGATQFKISGLTLGSDTALKAGGNTVGSWAVISKGSDKIGVAAQYKQSSSSTTYKYIALGPSAVNGIASTLSYDGISGYETPTGVVDTYTGTISYPYN